MSPDARDAAIRGLRRARTRSRFARASAAALAGLAVCAWVFGDLQFGRLVSPRSARNLDRFLGEVTPRPLRAADSFDFGALFAWIGKLLEGGGARGIVATLALSVAAIALAGIGAALLGLPASRTLARPEPFLPSARPPGLLRRAAWGAMLWATRFALIFLRSIPEYVWAFLLLALLGPGAWPAVLALALHNTGILGKLDAEIIENLDPGPMRALRGLGATRLQIAAGAVFPAALGRALSFFFYRWETCVREATVLGLLGFVSLGWYVAEARAHGRYDEMLAFILLAAALILAGDLVSALARALVRRAH